MAQLIFHLIGDYLLQSTWMAENKSRATWPAFCHATVYSLPFLLIGSIAAVLLIGLTHLAIDRFQLARYLIFAKDRLGPRSTWKPWSQCSVTGYSNEMPVFLSTGLAIICDNTLHLTINYAALRWL